MSSELIITGPGDLIAAVPAMLGFTPERSLVVIVLRRAPGPRRHEVHVVARVDLPFEGERTDFEIARCVGRCCHSSDAVAALAVIVDDRVSRPSGRGSADEGHLCLLATLERELTRYDTELAGAWGVTAVRSDAEWWSLRSPRCHGRLPDPTASLVAVRRVLDAVPIHGSRAELTGLVAVDEALGERVAQMLPDVVAEAQRRLARAVRIENPDAYSRMALWRVLAFVKQLPDSDEYPPRALAEVAVALRDISVRDCMFGVAAGVYAVAAEQLWLMLVRALPGADRAEAAMLLAFSAYHRGDGVLAGVALEAALESDPSHRMAQLLDTALRNAMPPSRLQKLARCGIDAAADLRVDIGVAEPNTAAEVMK